MPTAVALSIHSHRPSDATIKTWRSLEPPAGTPRASSEQQEAAEALDSARGADEGAGGAGGGEGSGSTVTSGLLVTPTVQATAVWVGGRVEGGRVNQTWGQRWRGRG